MTDWQFVKIKTRLGDAVVVSECGELNKPVAIFYEKDINRLMGKWKND